MGNIWKGGFCFVAEEPYQAAGKAQKDLLE